MVKMFLLTLVVSSLFLISCGGGLSVHIESLPNPVPNKSYTLHHYYETKVLEDPRYPTSELVDAVVVVWVYYTAVGDAKVVSTPVLKSLVTKVLNNQTGEDFIEWKSKVLYRRFDRGSVKGISDGVVYGTQVVIHKRNTG